MRDHAALIAYLAESETVPFGYGPKEMDCARFAAGGVKAQTGRNPLRQEPRLRWSSEAGAEQVLKRHGGLIRAVTDRLRSIPPAMARRGDVALIRNGRETLLGLVEGETLVAKGDRLERYPRSAMIRAWSADG